MLKATGNGPTRNPTLFVGLSFGNLGNLDKLRAEPLDSYILIDGKALGLNHDVMIFAGETEAAMYAAMAARIGPNTKVHIDPRSKN